MPWRETDPMNQKALFIADYLRNSYSITDLCEHYQISRKTGYKWIDRYLIEGPMGLEDRPRRPKTINRRTPQKIEDAIIKARHKHPTWGAKKLLKYLSNDYDLSELPVKSTVCDILKRNNLVPKKRRRRPATHPGKPVVDMLAPNQTWCADYKGQFKTRDGVYCYPLTITDGYSRYILECKALLSTELETAKTAFKTVFRQYGLPQVILTDNGTPFAANSLARLTRLSAWWIQLGITPALIEPGNPQQNGRHERMHKTLKQETTLPPAYNLRTQQRKFNAFKDEFNNIRPHEALDMETPNDLYAPSLKPYPEKIEPYVYPDRFETRLVSTNGGIRWRNDRIPVSHVLINQYIGFEEIDYGLWNVFYCHVKIGVLDEKAKLIQDCFGRLERN